MAVVIGAAPAAAEKVTLGEGTPQATSSYFYGDPNTLIQTALPNGVGVTPPGDGRITAWWAIGRGTASAELRVVRTVSGGQFLAEQTSSEQSLSETMIRFPTSLPAHSGDLIGVTIHADQFGGIEVLDDPNSAVREFRDAFSDGGTETGTGIDARQLQLGAEFVYTPTVSGLTPASGSTHGGQNVAITGEHLTDSTAVRFGSTPALRFTIDSSTRITAVAPASPVSTVNVTVAGPGGLSTTSTADRYRSITPQATVRPTTLNFGSVRVGRASAAQKVSLINTGTVPVAIGAARLTGRGATDFRRISDTCSRHRVARGGSCSVKFVFVPNAKGPHTATLTLHDDSAGGPHSAVLAGRGLRPRH